MGTANEDCAMGLRLRIMLVFLLMAGLATSIVVAGVVSPLLEQYEKANAELAAASRQDVQLAVKFLADRRDQAEKIALALAADEELTYRNYAAVAAEMRRLGGQGGLRHWIVAVDDRGRAVAGSEPGAPGRFVGLPVFAEARGQAGPVWSDRMTWPGSDRPTVAVAARYRYYDRQGAHWGVVLVSCDLAAWNAALNRQGSRVEVFDRQGRRLVPPAPADGAGRHEVKEALAGRHGNVQHAQAMLTYAPVPGAGWAVVASAPAAETLLPIHENIETASRLGVLALLVTGVLSFFLSGFLVAPIRRLEAAAAALTRGEWEAAERGLPGGGDELGRLSASFAMMAAQLKGRFAEIEAEVAARTRELARANSQLTDAIKELQELDELKRAFLDAVSHELRTPLNFIMGYGSGLEDGLFGALSPEQRRAVEGIMDGSERLLGIVNDLIEVSRLEAGQLHLAPQPLDLQELLGLALRQAELSDRGRHRLALEVEPGLPSAFADPESVGQILRQLLSNAVKFTEPGGAVTLSARREGGDQGEARNERRVVVAVKDTGRGIAPEALPHIWESFRQIDGSLTRQYGGTGVGLTIVKRLIDAMGERVEVESTPGVGTTFRFTLPIDEAKVVKA